MLVLISVLVLCWCMIFRVVWLRVMLIELRLIVWLLIMLVEFVVCVRWVSIFR